MFAKAARLNRTKFSECFARGTRFSSSYTLVIRCVKPTFACSVVVSKKVAKKAHDRNRLRRQAYAVLRSLQDESPVSGWYIVTLKPGIASLSRQAARAALCLELGQALKTR